MEIDKLITCIFVRPSLWDQRDSRHHNRYVLDKMWDEVAHELNSTRESVRGRWKSLRDGFRKELKKAPKGRSGDSGCLPCSDSTWPHFKSLYFLKDQFTSISSSGDLSLGDGMIVAKEEIETENNEVFEHLHYAEKPSGSSNMVSDVETENSESSNSSVVPPTQTSTIKRGIKRSRQQDMGNTLLEIEKQRLKFIGKQKKMTDEDASFFDSLLPHIKGLTPARKMLLRLKMQELVYNFVYEDSQTQTRLQNLTQLQSSSQQCQHILSVSSRGSNSSHSEANCNASSSQQF